MGDCNTAIIPKKIVSNRSSGSRYMPEYTIFYFKTKQELIFIDKMCIAAIFFSHKNALKSDFKLYLKTKLRFYYIS